MARNSTAALPRLRAICLTLPEAEERETWETPTFRIRDKIFAMFRSEDGVPALWCKAPPGVQAILIGADPKRFFRPPYVGHKGWIGVRLDSGIDWDEVNDLVRRSYGMTAPKRMAATILTSGKSVTPAACAARSELVSRHDAPARSVAVHRRSRTRKAAPPCARDTTVSQMTDR